MTPKQRSLVMALVVRPGGAPALTPDAFLREFGASDGVAISRDLLRDAVDRCDPTDVELALVVSFKFGFSDEHLDLLHRLAFADWHHSHEDVASALGTIRSPVSIGALMRLATWIPSYLEFDQARALATKAIWALGSINTREARDALTRLASSDSAVVAGGARAQLQK